MKKGRQVTAGPSACSRSFPPPTPGWGKRGQAPSSKTPPAEPGEAPEETTHTAGINPAWAPRALQKRRPARDRLGPVRLLAELPASDSGSQSEKVGSVLEDSPLKHSRRANEAVGSTTTVIQQHLTSFASQAVDFGLSIHSPPMRSRSRQRLLPEIGFGAP